MDSLRTIVETRLGTRLGRNYNVGIGFADGLYNGYTHDLVAGVIPPSAASRDTVRGYGVAGSGYIAAASATLFCGHRRR